MMLMLIYLLRDEVARILGLLGSGARIRIVVISCIWASRTLNFSRLNMKLVLIVHRFRKGAGRCDTTCIAGKIRTKTQLLYISKLKLLPV